MSHELQSSSHAVNSSICRYERRNLSIVVEFQLFTCCWPTVQLNVAQCCEQALSVHFTYSCVTVNIVERNCC